jgi:biopolymer transport protein ExbD
MLDHPYSFIAVREGASLASDAIDWGPPLTDREHAGARVVRLESEPGRYQLDGQPKSEAELAAALSNAVRNDAARLVLLQVEGAVPFERVRRAADAIRSAGIVRIRLAPVSPDRERD